MEKMEDRFKFRAIVTLDMYDNGDDVEKTVLINNVALYGNGDIGLFWDDFLEQVGYELTEEQVEHLYNEHYINEDWIIMSPDKIQQCTGLKDKNGRLIYEGDMVKRHSMSPLDTYDFISNGVVKLEMGCFIIDNSTMSCPLFDDISTFEVIGNIHEHKHLLG